MRMEKVSIQEAFLTAGLARRVADIDLLARPSLRLSPTLAAESTLRVGSSKFGGRPDLPADIAWPERNGLPQSFIAQIRLAEAHRYDLAGMLPQSGMLWFFYDARQESYGDEATDLGAWRVFYIAGDVNDLQRRPAPADLPATGRFQASSVVFSSELTLSQQPQLEIPACDWSAEELARYENLLATFPDPAERKKVQHRMLGFADTIQDDMRLQCQLYAHGVTDPEDPEVARLSAGAMSWQLLLQVNTDERAGMRWGNAGMLYYWIQLADLQARRFGATWLVLQSE